jgi:hypothetical protein
MEGCSVFGIRIGAFILAVALVGCAVPAPVPSKLVPSAAPPAATQIAIGPSPTPTDPCTAVLARLGESTKRRAEALAALRPLITAKTFDAAETLGAVRRVSSLTEFDIGLEQAVAGCPATASLQDGIGALDAKLATGIDASLLAGFARRGQRRAAVKLWKLLPSVLALSVATRSIASSLGVTVGTPVIPPDSTTPTGKLPKLN